MQQLPQKFQCPHCFVSVPVPEQGEAVICPACQALLDVMGHLCVDCLTYHDAAVPLCETCGAPMTKVCRRCRTLNWAGHSYCAACGAGLDVIESLGQRTPEGVTAVAQQQMRESHTIKWQESIFSAERMEKLEEKEAARQAELQRREQILREKDRQLWKLLAIVIPLLILAIIVIALFL